MDEGPRGVFHQIEPALQKQISKQLNAGFKELVELNMDFFFALKELRKTINVVLYGDEYGGLARPLQRGKVERKRKR